MSQRQRRLRAVAALAAGLVASALAVPAAAQEDPEASTTGTVNVAVRSITVTPSGFTFGSCTLDGESTGDLLAFPRGVCGPTELQVTNGDLPSNIFVRATDVTPNAGGDPWNLVGSAAPGVDQALLYLSAPGAGAVTNTNTRIGGAVSPGETVFADTFLYGPEASTSASPSFATTITFTAAPPTE